MSLTVLERELYSIGEAARLLVVHPRTLRNWLEGYRVRGERYRPVIRPEPTGNEAVTWGEFVEAGYLREYRKRSVPLQRLRPFIERLRERGGVPYPLAHSKPFVGEGRELVVALQDELGLERGLHMWVERSGQLLLAPPAAAFYEKVEFDEEAAARLRPDGKDSPVVIDPRRSFGIPVVRGVRTEVIFELFETGEPMEALAEIYDLDLAWVEAAVRFEARRARRDTDPDESEAA